MCVVVASSRRLRVESRGYCAYMDNWATPAIGDKFEVEMDEINLHNRYAAVKVNGAIADHVPREVSKVVSGVKIRGK